VKKLINRRIIRNILLTILLFSFMGSETVHSAENSVVVYTSHDQIYSEPILNAFELKTGIRVKALYDVEAAKTVGIVNRLIAEKLHPRCDVFWNNEHSRTLVLKRMGLLAPYHSSSADDIPAQFKDAQGYWTGFGARARVIVYNKKLLKPDQAPSSILDLTEAKWKGQCGMANPLFGTTATQAAALFALWGENKAKQFFIDLKANNTVILPGNAVVKDMAASGEIKAGLTDTDDVNLAVSAGLPVAMVLPDQNGMGTLLIPNTVCLIKNSPDPGNGKKLIDFLLSAEVEKKLAFSPSAQIPVRKNIERPPDVPFIEEIKTMAVSYEQIAAQTDNAAQFLRDTFLR